MPKYCCWKTLGEEIAKTNVFEVFIMRCFSRGVRILCKRCLAKYKNLSLPLPNARLVVMGEFHLEIYRQTTEGRRFSAYSAIRYSRKYFNLQYW
jgi:hypothetical protein